MKTILALLLFVSAVAAQPITNIRVTQADPTGNGCNSTAIALQTPSGTLFTCQNGVYAKASSGGGGGLATGPTALWTSIACTTPTYVVSGTTAMTWDTSNCNNLTVSGGNTTVAFSGLGSLPFDGVIFMLADSTPRSVSWPANAHGFPGNPTPVPGNSRLIRIDFWYSGTDLWGRSTCPDCAYGNGGVAQFSDVDTPASGSINYYFDSTSKTVASRGDDDSQGLGVHVGGCVTGAFVKGLLNTGYFDCDIPTGSGGVPANSNLLSGGGVAENNGLVVTVSAATYTIQGTHYASPLTDITLADADPTNPRFDTILVDATGSASAITGTPDVDPLVPSVDPTLQLFLTSVLIPALATAPAITVDLIYDEDVGPSAEWTATKSGTPINLASTNNPYSGAVDVEATSPVTGNWANFAAAAPIPIQNYNYLVFYIRSKAPFQNNRQIQIQLSLSGTLVGSAVGFTNGVYGFIASQTTSYQQMVIPLAAFGVRIGSNIDGIRFTQNGVVTGWYLDKISLQAGLPSPLINPSLTYCGDWNVSANYPTNCVVTSGGIQWIALVSNTGSAPASANTNWAQQLTPIACIGTPGNTVGFYRQTCQTSAGALYACNNAVACAVAADWVSQGGAQVYPGAGIAVSTGSAWTTAATSATVVSLFTGCSGTQYLGADGACHNGPSAQVYPGSGIAVSTGSAWTTAATSTTIVGLFSTCSGTQYLGADGACHTPAAQVYPGAGIPVSTGSAWTTAATSSTIIGLFSTCSGTQYLGADGSCHNGSSISTPVSVANGGTGTGSTLTGLMRGNSSAMTAAELSGDATTSGSNAVTLATKFKTKSCVIVVGDPGAASLVLTDDNDSPVACDNDVGSDWTITTVACWANAGSPTVTPILTGGGATSVLTGALTCGTASWAAGTVNGSPVVHSFSAGATCSSTPCSIDGNVTTAGGVAKYLVIKIVGTI